ncbi:MAG: hypothetical protein WCP06_04475 [Verrucomicrobiota bacterium]
MKTPKETGGLDRIEFQAEVIQFGKLLDALTAVYQLAGLTQRFARAAALADLECTPGELALAA